MLDNLTVIPKENILEEVNNLKMYGYRFVSLTCEKEKENYELTYHFDLNYKMKSVRIIINPDDTVKSISHIYPSAFLIENEYQDLYGFVFENLTIDYKGNLYLAKSSPKTPLLDKKDK